MGKRMMKQVSGGALALCLAAAFGGAALAGPGHRAEAVLAASSETEARQIIDGRVWKCLGTGCRGDAASAPKSQAILRECRAVAAKFGELALYRSSGRELNAGQLARCNAAAKPREGSPQLAGAR
jgi:hypothetical protein